MQKESELFLDSGIPLFMKVFLINFEGFLVLFSFFVYICAT